MRALHRGVLEETKTEVDRDGGTLELDVDESVEVCKEIDSSRVVVPKNIIANKRFLNRMGKNLGDKCPQCQSKPFGNLKMDQVFQVCDEPQTLTPTLFH